MKRLLSILILFSIFFSATAADLPDDLKELQKEYKGQIKIWGVNDDDFEDEDDNEFFVLTFQSCQDERKPDLNYLMRVTVQLTDKKTGSTVFAQTKKKPRPVPLDGKYANSTKWGFQVPFGEMKKPKLTAYAIEFGIMKDGTFVPVGFEYDEVESAEQIMTGEGTEVKMKNTLSQHQISGKN